MNTTAKIIIAILAVLLAISVTFNVLAKVKDSASSSSVYNGIMDSVRTDDKSTVIYLSGGLEKTLSDSTAIEISEKR